MLGFPAFAKPFPLATITMKLNYVFILAIFFLLQACNFGAGTHGKIETYHFEESNNEIVMMVDKFLLENPDYMDYIDSTSGYGWIHIKIPGSNNRYGFRIGGNSEIVLIQSGGVGNKLQYGHDMWFFQENKFKKDFKENFIDLLEQNNRNIQKVYREPFTLTINKDIDTTLWPEYLIGIDTNLTYQLPTEFDSLPIDYFEDLVELHSEILNKEIFFNQHQDYFRLNQQCTGNLENGINITRFYRRIGQEYRFKTVFETKAWRELTDSSNVTKRLKAYSEIRKKRTENNYKETEVYSEFSEELWMKKHKNGS